MARGSGGNRIRLPVDHQASDHRSSFSYLWTKLKESRSPADVKKVLNKRVRLDGLPIRVRPVYILLTTLTLLVLSLLGFHPTLASKISPPIPFSDKLLHFVCFFVASALFYKIWSIDQSRREWWWIWFKELVSGGVCCGAGGILSEWVQSLLPYKTFQWGDVVANLLGSTLGILLSRHLHIRSRRETELRRLYLPVRMDPVPYQNDSEEEEEDHSLIQTEESKSLLPIPADVLGTPGNVGRKSISKLEESVWDDSEVVFGVGEEEEDSTDGGGKGKGKGKATS